MSGVVRAGLRSGHCICGLRSAVRFQGGATSARRAAADLDALAKAIAEEKYPEAKRLADALLRSGNPADRTGASLAYGRILLSLGQKAEFRAYRKTMRKQKLDPDGEKLMQVYDAWLLALEGKADQAVDSLAAILAKHESSEPTAEAADVLAMIHLGRGQRDKAQQAIDEGLKLFGYQGLKTAYIETLLRRRLTGWSQRLYEEAERLREQKKFFDAGRLYAQIRESNPQRPSTRTRQGSRRNQRRVFHLGHAAGFRIGQCLAGLDRGPQALDHWRKFIKESPTGPWRGQAHVAAADLLLESQCDLARAADHVREAAAVLDNLARTPSAPDKTAAAHQDDSVDTSWPTAAADVRLRQVIVPMLAQQYEAAGAAAAGRQGGALRWPTPRSACRR